MAASDSNTAPRRPLQNLLRSVVALVVLVASVAVSVVAIQNLPGSTSSEELTALEQMQAEQLARINKYRYVDRKGGTVAIPIDVAIERYVAEQAHGTTRPSGP